MNIGGRIHNFDTNSFKKLHFVSKTQENPFFDRWKVPKDLWIMLWKL